MKTTRTTLLALILLGAVAGTASASTSVAAGIHIGPSGRTSVDLGFFYDDLAPYGHWIQRPSYGWVFVPRVAADWRPYSDGRWVWTDDGWSWISDEPYGWATYHYGRWYDDPDYGWGWVPGDEWAPAWVSWQADDDYVGWAPLPPYASYRPGVTLSVRLAPEAYIFVPQTRFLARGVYSYAVPRYECDRIYRRARNYTRYEYYGGRGIYNGGVPYDRIQRRVGRIPRYQVSNLGWNDRHRGARFESDRVSFFRPQVQRTRVAPPPDRRIARRAVADARIASEIRGRQQERRQLAFRDQRNQDVRRDVRHEDRRVVSRQTQVSRGDDRQRGRAPQAQTWRDRRETERQVSRQQISRQTRTRVQEDRGGRTRVEERRIVERQRVERQPRFQQQDRWQNRGQERREQQRWQQPERGRHQGWETRTRVEERRTVERQRMERQPRVQQQDRWQQNRGQDRRFQQQDRRQQRQDWGGGQQRQPRAERQRGGGEGHGRYQRPPR